MALKLYSDEQTVNALLICVRDYVIKHAVKANESWTSLVV